MFKVDALRKTLAVQKSHFSRDEVGYLECWLEHWCNLSNGQIEPNSKEDHLGLSYFQSGETATMDACWGLSTFVKLIDIHDKMKAADTRKKNKPRQNKEETQESVNWNASKFYVPGYSKNSQSKSYTRKIEEPLGSREDFNKDRKSWKRTNS